MKLNDTQLKEIDENGYVILPDCFSNEEVNNLCKAMTIVFNDGGYNPGGGGGFDNDGGGWSRGRSFMRGGKGGASYKYGAKGIGGFGGGGGSRYHPGGGGGGYTGGTGIKNKTSIGGYGGGSRNNGTNQTNTAGYNNGHGKVIITFVG